MFNFGGGTLQAAAAMSSSLAMTLTGSGGNATLNTAGYAVSLSGPLTGTGGLIKIGSGTLTLAAANTYSGNTLISGGTARAGVFVGFARQHAGHQRQREIELRLADRCHAGRSDRVRHAELVDYRLHCRRPQHRQQQRQRHLLRHAQRSRQRDQDRLGRLGC